MLQPPQVPRIFQVEVVTRSTSLGRDLTRERGLPYLAGPDDRDHWGGSKAPE